MLTIIIFMHQNMRECVEQRATATPHMRPIHHTLKQNNYINYKLLIRFGQMCDVLLQCNHIIFYSCIIYLAGARNRVPRTTH